MITPVLLLPILYSFTTALFSLAQYRSISEGSFMVCITMSAILDLNNHTTDRIQLRQFDQALEPLDFFFFKKTSNSGRQITKSFSFSERNTSASLQILSQQCFNIYFKIQVQEQKAVFCFGLLKKAKKSSAFLTSYPFHKKGTWSSHSVIFQFLII